MTWRRVQTPMGLTFVRVYVVTRGTETTALVILTYIDVLTLNMLTIWYLFINVNDVHVII